MVKQIFLAVAMALIMASLSGAFVQTYGVRLSPCISQHELYTSLLLHTFFTALIFYSMGKSAGKALPKVKGVRGVKKP